MTDAELLSRIDERTVNIHELVKKQAEQLDKINGTVDQNCNDIATLKERSKNHAKWLGGITTALVTAVLGLIAAWWRLFGK